MKRFGRLALAAVAFYAVPAHADKKPRAVTDLTPGSPADVLPDTFRGSITYHGIYKGKASAPSQMTTSWGRKLEAALGPKMYPGAGDFTITIEFSGNRVTGASQTTSGLTQGDHVTLDPGHFIGTRQGATCHLQWSDGSETTDYCGRSEYRSRIDDTAENGQKSDFTIMAPAAELADSNAPVETQQASLRSSLAGQRLSAGGMPANGSDVGKRIGAAIMDPIGKTHSARESLDAAILLDSQGWLFNRYAYGSMTNVSRSNVSKDGRSFTLSGQFSYQSGNSGAVRAHIVNGEYNCFEYADFPGRCKPAGAPSLASQMAVGALVAGIAAGSGSSKGHSSADDMLEHCAGHRGESGSYSMC